MVTYCTSVQYQGLSGDYTHKKYVQRIWNFFTQYRLSKCLNSPRRSLCCPGSKFFETAFDFLGLQKKILKSKMKLYNWPTQLTQLTTSNCLSINSVLAHNDEIIHFCRESGASCNCTLQQVS